MAAQPQRPGPGKPRRCGPSSHTRTRFKRPGASALTAAELRLLLLSTHLPFPGIAGQLFLSRHTIKSQANAISRKLGACSRSQAVARSRDLGLLEG